MADIPFVSENFQRSFRNTFPSQTSTGRDLHVSDVVIPIVDFTPTSATTSLPFPLLSCGNPNTQFEFITAAGLVAVTINPGFYRMEVGYLSSVTLGFSQIFITDTSTSTNFTLRYLRGGANQYTQSQDFIFIPVGFTLSINTSFGSGGTGRNEVLFTPIADTNGNLIQPSGYDPQ